MGVYLRQIYTPRVWPHRILDGSYRRRLNRAILLSQKVDYKFRLLRLIFEDDSVG